jgi:hypothetical protein
LDIGKKKGHSHGAPIRPWSSDGFQLSGEKVAAASLQIICIS